MQNLTIRFYLILSACGLALAGLSAADGDELYEAVQMDNIALVRSLLARPEHRKYLNQANARYAASARESKDPTGGRLISQAPSLRMAKFLVDSGAEIRSDDGYIINTVIENGFERAHAESYQWVVYLVEKGADFNQAHPYHRRTPLHYSLSYNTFQITSFLVEKGADVNARDKEGRTPLHGLLSNFDHETRFVKPKAELLVRKGADINARDKRGWTPLMHAVGEILPEPTYVLVRLGADVNLANKDGNTALHIAAIHPDLAEVRFLIQNGARIDVKNDEGQTAADTLRTQLSAATEYGRRQPDYRENLKVLALLEGK